MYNDEPEYVNETDKILSEFSEDPATLNLAERVNDLIEDSYPNASVLSALIKVFVSQHISMHTEEDMTICRACLNSSLTEIFQVMRRLSQMWTSDLRTRDCDE